MRQFIVDGLYTYTNILLLGIFAGCIWYVARLLRYPKEKRWDNIWQQLNQQHWLFGQWGMQLRNKLAPWLFCVAAAIYQFEIFFVNSLYRERLPYLYNIGTLVLDQILILCLTVKILFCSKYSARQLAVVFCMFFVMRWVFFNNHNQWVMLSVLLIMAAKDIPLRRALKGCFAIGTASVVVVAASSLLGIIDTLYDMETGRYRNSFGYGWYNYFGACLLGLALMYVCLRRLHRLKWYDFCVLLGLAVFSDKGPDSRAVTICLVLLTVALFLLRVIPRVLHWLPVKIILSFGPMLAFGLSMAVATNWNPESKWMTALNALLSGRVELSWNGLNEMPFRIAGQIPSPNMLVDNAYVQHWIISGPVVSLLIWTAFSLLIWRLISQNHFTEVACCLVMVCHGLMEIHVTWACMNITIWLLSGVLYWPAEQPNFSIQDIKCGQKKENIQ